MAVERLTDYTRRIWTGLGPDAPEGHDIHVNDVIYYMDSSECCVVRNVYPDGSIDCETLPDVGGGGGGGLKLLASGTYVKPSNGLTMKIPVSYTGTPKLFYFYVPEPLENTGQTVFGARWVDLENSEANAYTNNGQGFCAYTQRNTSNVTVYAAPSTGVWPEIAASFIAFGRSGSFGNFQHNTYKWFIYG